MPTITSVCHQCEVPMRREPAWCATTQDYGPDGYHAVFPDHGDADSCYPHWVCEDCGARECIFIEHSC